MGVAGERRTQVLKGALDLCVLAVLTDGPVYGYELVRALEGRGLQLVAEGSIYPLLSRLERVGLVDTYRQPSPGGPPRKYYRVTDDGRDMLQVSTDEWRAVTGEIDQVLEVCR